MSSYLARAIADRQRSRGRRSRLGDALSTVQSIASLAYSNIAIDTGLGTPTINIPVTTQISGGGGFDVMSAIQPTVTLSGNAGSVVVAPWGVAQGLSPGGALLWGIAAALLAGAGYIGYELGRS